MWQSVATQQMLLQDSESSRPTTSTWQARLLWVQTSHQLRVLDNGNILSLTWILGVCMLWAFLLGAAFHFRLLTPSKRNTGLRCSPTCTATPVERQNQRCCPQALESSLIRRFPASEISASRSSAFQIEVPPSHHLPKVRLSKNRVHKNL